MQLGGAARLAWGDPVGALALAVLIIASFAGVRAALMREPPGPTWRFGLELTAAAGSAALLRGAVVQPDMTRLARGPLHPLLAQTQVSALWSRLQAALLIGAPAAVLAATLLPDALRALLLLVAVACGFVIIAPALNASTPAAIQVGIRSPVRVRSASTGPWLIARVQARGRDGRSRLALAASLVIIGAGAGRLALLNNPGPELAAVLTATACGAAGSMVGRVDVQLLRFLARTPVKLMRLLAAACLPAAGRAAAAVAAAGLLIGLGPAYVFVMAAAIFMGIASLEVLTALHALSGRPTFARMAAVLDMALMGVLIAGLAPAAPVWAAARTAWLWRAAERGRWLWA